MKFVRLYYIGDSGPYVYFKNKSLGKAYSEKEVEALDSLIEVVKEGGFRRVYVLFSGGRDSLVALHLARRVRRALGLHVKAVHVDTTISTPGNLEYVSSTCKRLGVKLTTVRPRQGFFELVEKWGFPTVTRRWCCYYLKIEPLKRYFAGELLKGQVGLIVDGTRADESPRRRGFPKNSFHKHFKMMCYHPILDWTRQDVLEYISRHKLQENPLYKKLPRATDCWCTAFKTPRQFMVLKREWPDLFERFVEAEKKLRTGGSALFRKGSRIYLRDL